MGVRKSPALNYARLDVWPRPRASSAPFSRAPYYRRGVARQRFPAPAAVTCAVCPQQNVDVLAVL